MEIRIYVANLAEYVAGRLVGEWIDLPCDDLQTVLDRISNDGQDELAIHDFEAPFRIEEYDSISGLNELAETLAESDEDGAVIETLFDGLEKSEALEALSNGDYRVYWDCDDMADVAEQFADETGLLQSIPDNLQCYFDFERFGRDMEIEGTFIRGTSGGRSFYVEVTV